MNDIAKKLEKEFDLSTDSDVNMRGLVWLTLEELERYSLIKEYLRQPATVAIAGISRRNVIETATLVGGFAIGSMFPVVKSIAVPDPNGAASRRCIPLDGGCVPGSNPRQRDGCCQGKSNNVFCSNRTNPQPGQTQFACEER